MRFRRSGMDPRVKPEDDEGEVYLSQSPASKIDRNLSPFVILGLDPRIHA